MAVPVSVRLDDESFRALRALEASGLSRSGAIRRALIESADRLRRHAALADAVARLEADEQDRAEMADIADLVGELRAPR